MADKTQINLERIRACDAEWEESKHPRSENGRFTSGSGAHVSKLQSGGKAKESSIKAGEIAKNQERYDNAHKSMAANYLSDLTNAIKGGDYETAREKLERHEKDKKRYDQLTAQNNKFKAAKKTLEKARPGIAKMREQAKAAGDFPRRNVEAALKAHIKEIKSNFAGYPEAAKKLENEARETFKQLEKSGKLDDVAKMLDRQAQLKAEGDKTRNMTERANWFDNLSKEDKSLASVSFVGVAKMALDPTSAKPKAPAAKPAQAGGSNQQSADKFTKVADNLKRVDSTAAKYARQMSKVAAKSGEAAALKWAENMRAKIEADQDMLPIEKGFLGGRLDIVLKEYNKSAENPAPQPAPAPTPNPSKKSDVGQKGIDYLRSISHVNSSAEENTGYTARNMIDMINQGKTLKEIRSEMRSNIKKHSPDIDRDLQHLDSIIAKVKRAQQ